MDFIMLDRKFAVVEAPSFPFMLSHTVTLSMLRFFTAST